MNEFLTLMKPELIITVIIFLLLFIKIGKGIKNETLLLVIQVLLLLNFIAGFFFNEEGRVKSLPEPDDCVLTELSVAM